MCYICPYWQLCSKGLHIFLIFTCSAYVPSVSDFFYTENKLFFIAFFYETEEKYEPFAAFVLLFQGHFCMKFCWRESRVAAALHILFCLPLAGRMVQKQVTCFNVEQRHVSLEWGCFAVTLALSAVSDWVDLTVVTDFILRISPVAFVPGLMFICIADKRNRIGGMKNTVFWLWRRVVMVFVTWTPYVYAVFFPSFPVSCPFIFPSFLHLSSPFSFTLNHLR